MKYTVRTAEGELRFGSFGEVETAWLSGLVGPEDDVLEEGATKWRKASSYPLLMKARRHGNQVWGGTQLAWIAIFVTLGSITLYLLAHGSYLPGLGLAIVLSVLLTRVTWRAFRKTKPYV